MNERIRELARQANISAIDGVWDYNDRNLLVKDDGEWRVAVPSEIISTMIQGERGLEKFAELIVQECSEFARQHNLAQAERSYMIHEAMKKHFGVEE